MVKLRFPWTLKHNTMQSSAQSSFYKGLRSFGVFTFDPNTCSKLHSDPCKVWKNQIGFKFETLFVFFCSNGRLVVWETGSMKLACNFIKKHEVVLVCGVSKSPINLIIPGWICPISCHRSHFTHPIKKKNIFWLRKQSLSKETKALLLFYNIRILYFYLIYLCIYFLWLSLLLYKSEHQYKCNTANAIMMNNITYIVHTFLTLSNDSFCSFL